MGFQAPRREDKHLEAEMEPGYDRQRAECCGLGHCLVVAAGREDHRIVKVSLKIFLKSCHSGGMVQDDLPCVRIAMHL